MASGKKIQIYGKTYSLKSSSEVDADEVAGYVDSKMKELANASSKTSTLDLAILAALNIAQELLALKIRLERKMRREKRKSSNWLRHSIKSFKILKNKRFSVLDRS